MKKVYYIPIAVLILLIIVVAGNFLKKSPKPTKAIDKVETTHSKSDDANNPFVEREPDTSKADRKAQAAISKKLDSIKNKK